MRTNLTGAGWLAAAWLVPGCTLIDYERPRGAFDGAEERVADASSRDPLADASSMTIDAQPSYDASRAGDASTSEDAQSSRDGDAGTDAALACSSKGMAPGNPVLIDDLEDGDPYIIANYGMSGAWYMIDDGTGGQLTPASSAIPLPTAGGALGSQLAMHFMASGFTSWGAGLAVSLNAYGCPYDASIETGIEFMLKGAGTVLVSVATAQTVPVAEHGTCVSGCNDHYAMQFTLGNGWKQKYAEFALLQQSGYGTAVPFDPSAVMYVQFTVLANSSVDAYVDNLSFY